MCADVHNTCLTYTTAHAWCSQHLLKCTPHSPQKMHMHSCMCAYATVQKLLCHDCYCKLIFSLARASYRLSFAAIPPAGSTKWVAWRYSLKKSVIFAFSARFCCITTNLFAQCLLKVLMPFVAIKSYTQLSWKSFEPENLPCQYSCCTFNIIVDLFTNNANAIGTLCPAEVSNAHK